jgi:hypothetical protein
MAINNKKEKQGLPSSTSPLQIRKSMKIKMAIEQTVPTAAMEVTAATQGSCLQVIGRVDTRSFLDGTFFCLCWSCSVFVQKSLQEELLF